MSNIDEKLELEKSMTEQQILFCKLYVSTTSSNKENYMTAYPNSNPKSAEANSSRLLKNEKVKKYINMLLDEMADNCEISDKEILRELKRIAFGSRNDNARIKALTLLGEVTGLFDKGNRVTNNLITISVDDKDKKQLEDNQNGKIIGTSFEIIDEETSETSNYNNDDK